MTLQEAYNSCRQGDFVSHSSFDSKQSMHYYDGSLYYEDGAILDTHLDWLEKQKWFNNDEWYIKYTTDQVDIVWLNNMHSQYKTRTLPCDRSFEECITHQTTD